MFIFAKCHNAIGLVEKVVALVVREGRPIFSMPNTGYVYCLKPFFLGTYKRLVRESGMDSDSSTFQPLYL